MYHLREIERRDIKEINKWHNDKNLSDFLGGGYFFVGEEVDQEWFDRYLKQRSTAVRLAIVDEEDRIVGCVYLLDINRINQCAELHIVIGNERNRGKGIGSYAVKSLVEYAFYNLNLHRVQLEVLTYNKAAIALYKKCGFIEEGIRQSVIYKNGKYVDVMMMALLRENYIQVS